MISRAKRNRYNEQVFGLRARAFPCSISFPHFRFLFLHFRFSFLIFSFLLLVVPLNCAGDRVALLTITALDAAQYDRKESLRGHNKQLWVLTATVTTRIWSYKEVSRYYCTSLA